MPRSSSACSSRTSRSSSLGSSSMTTATFSRKRANSSATSSSASSTSDSNSVGETCIKKSAAEDSGAPLYRESELPARGDVEAVDHVFGRSVERLGDVHLDRDVAEQQAQSRAHAHDGNTLVRV